MRLSLVLCTKTMGLKRCNIGRSSLSYLLLLRSISVPRFLFSRRTLCVSASHRKEEFNRTKPHFNVGTIGHVDHGKTTLTSAITKVLADSNLAAFHPYEKIDNLPEERRRGITINAQHVEYETANRHYSHVDCPGHIDFVKNMIVGAFQADGAVLVLAANSGVMPQTREHIILAKQIGLEKLVVFLNKADLVDKSTIELCEDEIREMLSDHGFDGLETPVIVGSAKMALEERKEDWKEGEEGRMSQAKEDNKTDLLKVNSNRDLNRGDTNNGANSSFGKESILQLVSTMDEYFDLPARSDDVPSLLPISNTYSIPGRGTVVSGILQSGTMKKGDAVDIVGYDQNLKSTIGSIETFHKTLTKTRPGDNIGLLLRGLRRQQLRRGMVVAKAGAARVNNRVKARVYLLDSDEGGLDEPLCQDDVFKLFSQTFHIVANVNRVIWGECAGGGDGDGEGYGDGDGSGDGSGGVDEVFAMNERQMVMPGEEATMELMTYRKLYLPVGSRFTLRTNSLTIGYGVVTESLKDADEAMLKKKWKRWSLPLSK